MMNIILSIENRKTTALRLADITGETYRYTKVPRCAYEVGPYFLEKDGIITMSEDTDLTPLQQLVDEGLLEPFEEPEVESIPKVSQESGSASDNALCGEVTGFTISLPLEGFNPDSLETVCQRDPA